MVDGNTQNNNATEEKKEVDKKEEVQKEKKEEKKVVRRRAVSKKATTKEEIAIEDIMLFGKYPIKDVSINDPSIFKYVNINGRKYPNTFGRRKYAYYYNAKVSVVERLINKLMRGGTGEKVSGKVIRTEGRLQGKKLKVTKIVEKAFDKISKDTNKNPLQVLIDAIENAAPIEDVTRVRYGGIIYNVEVGVSAQRRVDVALRNIALAALINSFKSKKRLYEALAEEIENASNNSPNSFAIKRKVELERIARSAR